MNLLRHLLLQVAALLAVAGGEAAGHLFIRDGHPVAPLFLGLGLGLAILWRHGVEYTPAVLFGLVMVRVSLHPEIWLGELLVAGSQAAQAVVTAAWARRWFGSAFPFASTAGILRFLFIIGVAGASVGTLAASGGQLFSNALMVNDLTNHLVRAFNGNLAGILVVSPFYFAVAGFLPRALRARTWTESENQFETASVIVLVVATTALAFRFDYPLPFVPLPFLFWAGYRLTPFSYCLALVLAVGTMLICTLFGPWGPFVTTVPNHTQTLLMASIWTFLACFTTLLLGAVTAEKSSTETELAVSTARQSAILEHASYGILGLDRSGRINLVNTTGASLLGRVPQALMGHGPGVFLERPLNSTVTVGKAAEASFLARAALGEGEEREWEITRADGSTFPAVVSVAPVRDKKGVVAGFVAIVRDNTQLYRAVTEMQQAWAEAEAANEAKSTFLASMSHEIRTPMNAILGFTELLEQRLSDPQLRNYAAAIGSSGKTLLQLINDILDLSKIEAGRLEINPTPTNLPDLLRECSDFFRIKAAEKGLYLKLSTNDAAEGFFLIDEVRIKQVLFNLIGNALKFTERGGVEVVAQAEPGETDGTFELVISVVDTGVGIPVDQRQRIFEPFAQQAGQDVRKYGGTGLGLPICRRLARLMGGEISLESEIGKGSIFSVSLPSVPQASASDIAARREEGDRPLPKLRRCKVLAVDDAPFNLDLVAGFLSDSPVKVIKAANGAEGVSMAREEKPDLILMDLRMPVMDGPEAIAILRSDPQTAKIPIIAATASTAALADPATRENVDGVLRKPITQRELLDELARFLAAGAAPAPKLETTATRPGFEFIRLGSFGPSAREKAAAAAPVHTEADLGPWLEQLRGPLTARWQELSGLLLIDEAEEWGRNLTAAEGLGPPPAEVREYGERVLAAARDFAVDDLTRLMAEFPNLIARLDPAAEESPKS